MADCVYVHGFGENREGKRARTIVDALEEEGYRCEVPDMHQPTFSTLTISAALEALTSYLDALRPGVEGIPGLLIGASMGGYLVARWAANHPRWRGRCLLLAPGMGMAGRWPTLVGQERMKRWEEEGTLRLPGPREELESVHWEFMEDMRAQPPVEGLREGTVIIHGQRDHTVPVETSQRLVECSANARLVEVLDGHALLGSLDIVVKEALDILGEKGRLGA